MKKYELLLFIFHHHYDVDWGHGDYNFENYDDIGYRPESYTSYRDFFDLFGERLVYTAIFNNRHIRDVKGFDFVNYSTGEIVLSIDVNNNVEYVSEEWNEEFDLEYLKDLNC